MSRLFARTVEVVVGTIGYGQARRFSEHRIDFRADHQHRDKPDEAEVSLWNLSRSQRAWLKENGEVVTIRAGYDGRLVDLFAGEVSRIEVEYRLPDIVTKIIAGDGLEVTLTQRIALTLSAGTTLRRALERISGVLGLPVAYLDPAAARLNDQFLAARSFTGRAADALEAVAQQAGLEWSIQDGSLYFITEAGTRPETAFVISVETGLVGTPELIVKRKKNRERIEGLRFKTLLIPEARPGTSAQLETREYTGPYKAERVIHQGDNGWGTTYYTTWEAKAL